MELGGNFIDTANVYSSGESEKIIGKMHCWNDVVLQILPFTGSWLQKRPGMREKVVLATKVGAGPSEPNNPNRKGLSRYHIMSSVELSLSRLCTTHIDLYQVSL